MPLASHPTESTPVHNSGDRITPMNRFSLIVPLCAVICMAQTPTAKQSKVEELFRLTALDKILGQSLATARSQIQASAMQQLSDADLTPKQGEILKDFENKMLNLLSENL